MIKITTVIFIFLSYLILTTQTYALVINEIYPAPANNGIEWVEIYNDSDTSVSLSDYSIVDEKDTALTWGQTSIDARAFGIATGTQVLNNTGDTVKLKKGLDVIDSITYPALASNQSYGRCTDGGGWQTLASQSQSSSNNSSCTQSPTAAPTNSQVNPTAAPTSYEGISITEAMPFPDGSGEWVELYNSNGFSVTLSSWYLDDIKDGGSSPISITLTIPAQGYGVYDLPSSMLNNDGDTVTLLDASQQVKSTMVYTSSEKGRSVGIYSGQVCIQSATKGSSNTSCTASQTHASTSPAIKISTQPSALPPKTTSPTARSIPTIDPDITIKLDATDEASTIDNGEVLAAEDTNEATSASEKKSPIRFLYAGTALASLITFVVLLYTIFKKKNEA